MLRLDDVHSGYGQSQVLKGISLELADGQVAALLGRNGAGKSTTVKTIMGLVPPRRGAVLLEGRRIDGLPPSRISRLGVAYVPEQRRIFSYLTVRENLSIAERPQSAWSVARLCEMFPRLAALMRQRAGTLSGGEQQMLAIARALATGPRLLLLDEHSQGLAPSIVDAVVDSIAEMRSGGLSILLVEQNLEVALDLADSVYLIDQGNIVFSGSGRELRMRADLQARYLGVET